MPDRRKGQLPRQRRMHRGTAMSIRPEFQSADIQMVDTALSARLLRGVAEPPARLVLNREALFLQRSRRSRRRSLAPAQWERPHTPYVGRFEE